MAKVEVTKYKDINKTYANGCAAVVDTNSEVIGMVVIDLADYPVACGENPLPTKEVLLINDPYLGRVWIDETVDSWYLLIGSTSGSSANPELTECFTIDGTVFPAGTTLTSPLLANAYINIILLNNNPVDKTTVGYTSGPGTLTFPGALGITDKVCVTYHKL